MISKQWRELFNKKGRVVTNEKLRIVKVLFDCEPGPYEASAEEQDEMDEIEAECQRHDAAWIRTGKAPELFLTTRDKITGEWTRRPYNPYAKGGKH